MWRKHCIWFEFRVRVLDDAEHGPSPSKRKNGLFFDIIDDFVRTKFHQTEDAAFPNNSKIATSFHR